MSQMDIWVEARKGNEQLPVKDPAKTDPRFLPRWVVGHTPPLPSVFFWASKCSHEWSSQELWLEINVNAAETKGRNRMGRK